MQESRRRAHAGNCAAWGLAAQAGSAGIWQGVKVQPSAGQAGGK